MLFTSDGKEELEPGTHMKTSSKQLKDSLDRQHILVGRQIAFLRRDELLRLICSGNSPSEKLISELGLTQNQASDILGLNLEYFKRSKALEIEDELNDLKTLIPVEKPPCIFQS